MVRQPNVEVVKQYARVGEEVRVYIEGLIIDRLLSPLVIIPSCWVHTVIGSNLVWEVNTNGVESC